MIRLTPVDPAHQRLLLEATEPMRADLTLGPSGLLTVHVYRGAEADPDQEPIGGFTDGALEERAQGWEVAAGVSAPFGDDVEPMYGPDTEPCRDALAVTTARRATADDPWHQVLVQMTEPGVVEVAAEGRRLIVHAWRGTERLPAGLVGTYRSTKPRDLRVPRSATPA
jgi:hypothetical protein